MGETIFQLILILISLWVLFDKDSPKPLKGLSLLGIILLVISVTARTLGISTII